MNVPVNGTMLSLPPPHMNIHRPLAMVAVEEGHGCHQPKGALFIRDSLELDNMQSQETMTKMNQITLYV